MTMVQGVCERAMVVLLDPERHASAVRREAQAHAARCPRCAGLVDDPGAADRVLAHLQEVRPAPRPMVRLVLAVLSVVQLAVGVPWLVGANPFGALTGEAAIEHLTRDGVLTVLVAVAGLVAAARPRRWRATVWVCVAALAVQAAVALLDQQRHHVNLRIELLHVLGAVIVAVTALAGRPRGPATPGPSRRFLRVVS